MRLLGNIIWLVLGGLPIALEYLIGSIVLMITIVGIPFGIQALKMASLALWPFGRTSIVTERASGCLHVLMNIIWLIFGGLWIAISHFLLGIILAITIIGIPFANQHFKLASIAISPFGRDIVYV